MWWKVGVAVFLIYALIVGGDLASIFIGAPVGVAIIVGFAILHEKMFKPDPMKESSFFETFIFGVMVLGAVLLSLWLIKTLIIRD